MAGTPLEAGSVIGRRYRLERELPRQGGMGVLWTALHVVTRRRVVVKLLRAGGHDDSASRARLLREARASCAVDHPSILPVLDVIDADGAPALVMDLLEGESLRQRLERERSLGVRETCAILAPVASALAAAHAARVVHRDIKPENIFLVGASAGDASVKVLDFGIAKIVATEETTTSLTESGAMLGTPYYMSPEQAFGERDVGAAADAWALGIVLYECLLGARPTQADNLGQVIRRITQDPMTPVEDVVPGVPAALASLVARLLERDATRREVDMARAAATLAECASAPSERGEGAERREGATVEPEPVAAAERRERPVRRWPRAASAALVVAGVAGLGGAVAIAVGVASRGARTPSEKTAASEKSGASASSAASAPSVIGSGTGTGTTAPVGLVSASPSAAASLVALDAAAAPVRTGTGAPRADASRAASASRTAAGPATADAPHREAEDGGTTGPGHVIIKTPF